MPKLYRSPQFPQSCCVPFTCATTPGARTLRAKKGGAKGTAPTSKSPSNESFLTCPSCPYLAHFLICSLTHTLSVRFQAHPLLLSVKLCDFSTSSPPSTGWLVPVWKLYMTQQLFSLVRRELILVTASWLSTHDLKSSVLLSWQTDPGLLLRDHLFDKDQSSV